MTVALANTWIAPNVKPWSRVPSWIIIQCLAHTNCAIINVYCSKHHLGIISYIARSSLHIVCESQVIWGFPRGSNGKESACNAGDYGSVPGWGRSHGKGNGYPLQYSCLENTRNETKVKCWEWRGQISIVREANDSHERMQNRPSVFLLVVV